MITEVDGSGVFVALGTRKEGGKTRFVRIAPWPWMWARKPERPTASEHLDSGGA
jgi:hypothetical protein